jgi:hypothetical protein
VLCKLGGGERDDGSGREELGWVEEEKQEMISTIEKVPTPGDESWCDMLILSKL